MGEGTAQPLSKEYRYCGYGLSEAAILRTVTSQ